MITAAYVRAMARYNRWQNQNLYGCADRLSDADRKKDRQAFFGSIHKTLNHLLWGDRIWMHRFTGSPRPPGGVLESVAQHDDWQDLKRERTAFDATIIAWADGLNPRWLEGDLTWHSGSINRDITKPKALLVAHMFNHQTHHRGQVHCMLTQCGVRPGDTDMPFEPVPAI